MVVWLLRLQEAVGAVGLVTMEEEEVGALEAAVQRRAGLWLCDEVPDGRRSATSSSLTFLAPTSIRGLIGSWKC